MADKEFPQVVVDLLLAFGNLHDAGADYGKIVLAESTAHQRLTRRGIRQEFVLRDGPYQVVQNFAAFRGKCCVWR